MKKKDNKICTICIIYKTKLFKTILFTEEHYPQGYRSLLFRGAKSHGAYSKYTFLPIWTAKTRRYYILKPEHKIVVKTIRLE